MFVLPVRAISCLLSPAARVNQQHRTSAIRVGLVRSAPGSPNSTSALSLVPRGKGWFGSKAAPAASRSVNARSGIAFKPGSFP
jgi:hypothetical protein